MSNGWIKLHRQLRENPIYTNSKAVHCWIECLLRASHSGKGMYLNRQKTELKSGQFCLGRDEFGKSIGMSGSTAWYWLLQFEVDRMVDIKKTTQGSIVTILKWEEYQRVDSEVDNKKTTDEQQMNTNKKDKNDNNDKKKKSSFKKKKKPYFRGEEMRKAQGRWWVLPADGDQWKEYVGTDDQIEWK